MPTKELLKELSIKISELDFWKTEYRKKAWRNARSEMPYQDWIKCNDDPCWEMGLRIIGRSALWDPIQFLDWVNENKLKNKPKMNRDKNLLLFVQRNSSQMKESK